MLATDGLDALGSHGGEGPRGFGGDSQIGPVVANAIQERVAEALENPEGTGAGMTEEDASILLTALEEISGAAAELSAAGDLASARESFFALTRPMAKYRKLAGDERTIVAYCSMVKKAWIQPRGEIVNPYYGQAMPRCGEVVGE